MKKIILILVSLSILLSVSGCRKNVGRLVKKNTVETAVSQNTDSQTPVSTTVKFAADVNDTLNPLFTRSYAAKRIMERVYEPLFATDFEFNTFGVLAEGLTSASDGMSADVTLKKGVIWHNNTAFNSDDVVYTIRCITDGITNIENTVLASASRLNEHSVRIYFKRPVINPAPMLDFPIIKNLTPTTSDMSHTPMGTGRYRYSGKVSVDAHMFIPFESYHGSKASDSFDITVVNSYEKVIQMFRAGETDAFFAGEHETITAANGKTDIVDEYTDKMVYLGINYNNPIFWGVNTRKAIASIINKELIVSSILFGRAKAADSPVHPNSWICEGMDYSQIYSIDSADELMKKDGWVMSNKGYYSRTINDNKQDCIIRILTNNDETFIKAANLIANELTSFGINCSLHTVAQPEYESTVNAGYYDLFIGEASLGKNMDFSPLVISPNKFTYVNSQLEALISQLSAENDKENMKQLYQSCLSIIKEDTPFIPLYFKNTSIFYSEAFGE